jgi:DNA-directed RNA polymerase specialized sigma24 family protein
MIELGRDYNIFKPSLVAEKIGCSSQALRNAKKRAKRRLRAFLNEKRQLRK